MILYINYHEGSIIRPKVVRSVHYCPATKKTMERRYADLTNFDVFPSVNMYPTKDEDGNLLETEYGLSKYRDHQTLTIQEMPEKAPTGLFNTINAQNQTVGT